ncbi:MAG: hypothetical protein HKN92_04505 [Chitinophagales bacterium]|nr:hypothetical protein [Chitinophagales bacterium]
MDVTYKRDNILKGSSSNIPPQKFALWLGMASMTMYFAAITSAFIVKRADFNSWANFKLPDIFIVSTVIVILCSVLLQLAYNNYKKTNYKTYRLLLGLSLFAGISFIGTQLVGWTSLQNYGIFVDGNPSGSFLYYISGAHGLHLIGGIVALLITFVRAIRNRKNEIYVLQQIADPKRLLKLELIVTFWHYIDLIWVYLFIFFKVNYI